MRAAKPVEGALAAEAYGASFRCETPFHNGEDFDFLVATTKAVLRDHRDFERKDPERIELMYVAKPNRSSFCAKLSELW